MFLGTDPVTGKQHYATRTVRTSRRDAERMLNTMVHEQGLAVRNSATTGDLLEAWYEHTAGDFSPATAVEVRGVINRHLQPAVGRIPLNKLKASDLDCYYRQL